MDDDGPSTLVPNTHVGDAEGVPSFGLAWNWLLQALEERTSGWKISSLCHSNEGEKKKG